MCRGRLLARQPAAQSPEPFLLAPRSHDRRRALRRSFEEFKGLYNAAVDDAAGTRPKAKKNDVVARTAHGLDGGTLAAREAIKQEKARKKAEEAEKCAPAAAPKPRRRRRCGSLARAHELAAARPLAGSASRTRR